MARTRRRQRQRQRQQGGSPNVAYTGTAFTGAGGVPIENRAMSDSYASGWSDSLRGVSPYPFSGGRRSRNRRNRRSKSRQRGGACGACSSLELPQEQTGGHRPFGFELDNTMGGKVYSGLTQTPCPSYQKGGFTDTVGYSLTQPYTSASSNFMEYQSYGKSCGGMGGGGKRRRRKSRKQHRR